MLLGAACAQGKFTGKQGTEACAACQVPKDGGSHCAATSKLECAAATGVVTKCDTCQPEYNGPLCTKDEQCTLPTTLPELTVFAPHANKTCKAGGVMEPGTTCPVLCSAGAGGGGDAANASYSCPEAGTAGEGSVVAPGLTCTGALPHMRPPVHRRVLARARLRVTAAACRRCWWR